MTGDRLAAASYLLGPVALAAVLLGWGEGDTRFHARQALLLNLALGAALGLAAGVLLPQYILTAPAGARASLLGTGTAVAFLAALAVVVPPAALAYRGRTFRLPVLGGLADRLA